MKGIDIFVIKIADIILVAFLTIFAIFGVFIINSVFGGGDYVLITINGEKLKTISLSESGEYEIKAMNNFNKIKIIDGKVKMLEANCPDKYCVKHKPISNSNETITCLPNKVVIEIIKKTSDAEGLDTIAY